MPLKHPLNVGNIMNVALKSRNIILPRILTNYNRILYTKSSKSDRLASKKSNESSELGLIEKYLLTQYLLLAHFNAPVYDDYRIQNFITPL